MTMDNKTFNTEITKTGKICLWESGGGYTNTGQCQLITGRVGEKPKALYIRKRGLLSCSDHALIEIADGYHIVEASHHRGDSIVKVYEIQMDESQKTSVLGICIGEYCLGEWELIDSNSYYYEWFYESFREALDIVEKKLKTYHCREAMYIVYDAGLIYKALTEVQ